jgi:hypothetical protein
MKFQVLKRPALSFLRLRHLRANLQRTPFAQEFWAFKQARASRPQYYILSCFAGLDEDQARESTALYHIKILRFPFY